MVTWLQSNEATAGWNAWRKSDQFPQDRGAGIGDHRQRLGSATEIVIHWNIAVCFMPEV
jgi:hypothetical protein